MTASMAEQVRPSLEAEVQIATLSAAGSTLPGGMTELITQSNFYRSGLLTQQAHLAKPWLVMPVSALSKSSGINFGQILSQTTSSSPLNESQMLAGASDVRKIGTGTLYSVPVTEYSGAVSIDKGMRTSPAAPRPRCRRRSPRTASARRRSPSGSTASR